MEEVRAWPVGSEWSVSVCSGSGCSAMTLKPTWHHQELCGLRGHSQGSLVGASERDECDRLGNGTDREMLL